MSFSGNDYIPVSLDVLKDGMKIDYSIYRENNGEFLLLCKDVEITDSLIEKFKRLTYPTYKVYVPNSKFEAMADERRILHNRIKRNAFFKSYEQVKENTSKMLDKISLDDSVPVEIVDGLAQTVNRQVETMEISQIIQGINSVRKVDEYLHSHCVNVALLNIIIGRWLKLDADSLSALAKVGLLHDIGKLKIPQRILNKPSRLSEEEFDLIMNHPLYSHELLVRSGYTDERVLQSVIQHHERLNGSGYPFGLGMDKITEFAKITSISDVYDAMVTKRAYKDAHSPFEILSWFAEGCYSELDYNYVMVFIDSMVEEFKGKRVMLSNGRDGKVMFIHSHNIAHPIVQSGGEIINTSPDLKCVAILED
jgi:HD-GYP domain-containing protein (c-di-GMP phosphodiesterase class II)